MRGVIDPTVHGRECKSSLDCVRGARPSSSILNRKLNCKRDRLSDHELPSVFASTGLVKRRLSSQELAIAMDFPAGLHKRGSESELARWLEAISVPFKVRVQVVRSLQEWTRETKERSIGNVEGKKSKSDLDSKSLLSAGDECPDESRMTEEDIPLYAIPDSEKEGALSIQKKGVRTGTSRQRNQTMPKSQRTCGTTAFVKNWVYKMKGNAEM